MKDTDSHSFWSIANGKKNKLATDGLSQGQVCVGGGDVKKMQAAAGAQHRTGQ